MSIPFKCPYVIDFYKLLLFEENDVNLISIVVHFFVNKSIRGATADERILGN
jgi:hypothetical protein